MTNIRYFIRYDKYILCQKWQISGILSGMTNIFYVKKLQISGLTKINNVKRDEPNESFIHPIHSSPFPSVCSLRLMLNVENRKKIWEKYFLDGANVKNQKKIWAKTFLNETNVKNWKKTWAKESKWNKC